jgi:hypothetical protein
MGCGDGGGGAPRDASVREDAAVQEDAGALGVGDAGVGGCFDPLSTPSAGFVEVQHFESAERGVRITRARQPGERSAVGETFPYDLVRVRIEADGDAACVSEAAAMTYEFGHHNWNETWSVRTEKARYVVREQYDFQAGSERPWADSLEARSLEDDSLLWGPVDLEPDGCYSLPYDLNPCLMRTRIDEPPAGWGQQ